MANRQLCANCGKYADSTAKFCPECATPFPQPLVTPKASSGRKKWFAAVGAAIVALIIIGLVFGSDEKKKQTQQASAEPTSSAAAAADALIAQQREASTQKASAEATVAASLPPTPAPPPSPTPTPPYKLALVSASCNKSSTSYITCEGFVENLTAGSLRSVTAVAVMYDSSGIPVASDYALIDYNPILGGQRSPWKVYVRQNPAYSKWSIEFKELIGGPILTRDDTKNNAGGGIR